MSNSIPPEGCDLLFTAGSLHTEVACRTRGWGSVLLSKHVC